MNAIEFCVQYEDYINEIRKAIKPELYPILEELAEIDPHDLVKPDTWFPTESMAKGMVWIMFVDRMINLPN